MAEKDTGENDEQESEAIEQSSKPTDAQIFDFIHQYGKDIAIARGNPVLYIFYPMMGMIRSTDSIELYGKFLEQGEIENLDVIIHSTGGDLNEAYDIIKLCRNYTEKNVTVFVPMHAMSAATLIALGADKVVLTKIGKLGPLDPQVIHPDRGDYMPVRSITEIPEVLEKGLTAENADVDSRLKAEAIVKPIAQQVDPYYLTQHEKTADLAREYGQKLLSRRDITETHARRCLDYLIEYPTHSYSVDSHEIKKTPSLSHAISCSEVSDIERGEQIEYNLIHMINFYLYWDYKYIKKDEARGDPTMEFVFPEGEDQQRLDEVGS